MRLLMRLVVFVTFALLPIVTLLYFQIKFLPYHALEITCWHRIAVLLGLAMLFVALPIIHLKPRKREVKLGPQAEAWRASPYGILIGGLLAILTLGFSWLVATIPGEEVERRLFGFVTPTRLQRRTVTKSRRALCLRPPPAT
jgi:membrane protease YdiL (CAAX protease family)